MVPVASCRHKAAGTPGNFSWALKAVTVKRRCHGWLLKEKMISKSYGHQTAAL
jgi:hypothetical protein